jgi:hypothetical protein
MPSVYVFSCHIVDGQHNRPRNEINKFGSFCDVSSVTWKMITIEALERVCTQKRENLEE